MRIVFMGTPDFAARPLERLYAEGREIVGVFTQPDKPKNRGMKLSFSPVKEIALTHGTAVYQPQSLRDGEALGFLKELKPDLIAVVAYGKLLPRDILELPPLGCINIHGSLLPKYRGSAPIQHAVLSGEHETGVTSMYMAEEMDAGDVILTKQTQIGEDETSGELYDRLSILGAELLCETVDAIERGEVIRSLQNHQDVTFAPPLTKEMSPIDWTRSATEIKNQVRGLNPWPVATALIKGVNYKVFSVSIEGEKSGYAPGEVAYAGKNGIAVSCADALIVIKELQAPGGKRMAAADYVRGHPICP